MVSRDGAGGARVRARLRRGQAGARRSGARRQRDARARERAIAAAAITTSFFGAQAIQESRVSAAAWIAIACFVGVGLCVLAVLWPRHDWVFALSPARFIATYLEPAEEEPLELWAIHRDLALHIGASAERNRRQLRWLMIAFRAGALLIIAEVIAWIAALIDAT